MTRNASGFAKTTYGGKSGVYACRCCSRNTRQTAGDNDALDLCAQCYDLAGEENSLSDSGEFYQGAQWVLECIAELATLKGANASKWDDLKSAAEAKIARDATPKQTPDAYVADVQAQIGDLAQAMKIHTQVTKTSTPADAGLDTSLYAAAIKFGKTIQSPTNRAVFNRIIDHAADNATHTILVEKAQPKDAWTYMFKGDCDLLLGTADLTDLNRKYILAYFVKLNILA